MFDTKFIIGQFYIAAVMAAIIGKFLSDKPEKKAAS
jgi:hypothetical protein